MTLIDGETGERTALAVPNAERSPFTGQVAAFSAALRSGDRAAFSAARDLGTMRLVARAYASAGA